MSHRAADVDKADPSGKPDVAMPIDERPRALPLAVVFWVGVLFLFAGFAAAWFGWKWYQQRFGADANTTGSVGVRDPDWVPPGINDDWLTQYTLTDQRGKHFGTDDLKGKVAVVSFFFTSCPTACPRQNAKVKALHDEFDNGDVQFVSITCDPKRDTVGKLFLYAGEFGADPQRWRFLTGDEKYIRRIAAEIYFVPVGRDEATMEIGHSEKLLTIDRWGNIRGAYHWSDAKQMKEMRGMLAKLVAETEPPAEMQDAQLSPAPTATGPADDD